LHELGVGQRVWRREVNWPFDFGVIYQPEYGLNEILIVNPRDVLPPVPCAPAEPDPHKPEQHIERASAIRTHDDG